MSWTRGTRGEAPADIKEGQTEAQHAEIVDRQHGKENDQTSPAGLGAWYMLKSEPCHTAAALLPEAAAMVDLSAHQTSLDEVDRLQAQVADSSRPGLGRALGGRRNLRFPTGGALKPSACECSRCVDGAEGYVH